MPFYGGLSLGGGTGGDNQGSPPQGYEQILQALLRQFPGLSAMQGGMGQGQTTGSLGYNFPGQNLYSGQAASGGGLYGSTGTGIFEGASAGQPESITGGLASGSLGRSPSQAPLPNTGQPGTSLAFGGAPMGGQGSFTNLQSPGSTGLGGQDLSQWAQADASQSVQGAPPQQYDVFGTAKQVIGGIDTLSRQGGAETTPTFPGGGAPMHAERGAGGAPPSDLFNPNSLGGASGIEAPSFGGFSGPDLNNPSFGTFGGGNPMTDAPFPLSNGSTGDPGMIAGLLDRLGLSQYLPYLQGAAGVGGLLTGGYGIANAIQTGNLPQGIVSGAGLVGGAAALGSTGALGSAGTAFGAAAAPVLGTLALPLAGAALWASNEESQRANKIQSALRDTGNIRRDFGTAWPQLEDAGANFEQLLGVLQLLPPEAQAQALPQIIARASRSQGATAAVSQFLSTQGGRHGTLPGGPSVSPLDVSGYEQQSGPLTMQAIVAELAARDRLDQLGSPYDPSQMNHDPTFMLNALQGYGGVSGGTFGTGNPETNANPNFQQPTPEEMAALQAPGGRMQGLQALFSRLNPQFGQSPLAQMLGQFQPYLGGSVSPGTQGAYTQWAARDAQAREQEQARQMQEQWAQSQLWQGGGGGYAQGGLITEGDPAAQGDTVPIMAQQGEYVMPRETVQKFGPVLDQLRQVSLLGGGAGGWVGQAEAAEPAKPTTTLQRFYMRDGAIYDGGLKITKQELSGYLQRQQQAMENNAKEGPLGERANVLLRREYENALDIYKQLERSK